MIPGISGSPSFTGGASSARGEMGDSVFDAAFNGSGWTVATGRAGAGINPVHAAIVAALVLVAVVWVRKS